VYALNCVCVVRELPQEFDDHRDQCRDMQRGQRDASGFPAHPEKRSVPISGYT
jgi:hypothetical protein